MKWKPKHRHPKEWQSRALRENANDQIENYRETNYKTQQRISNKLQKSDGEIQDNDKSRQDENSDGDFILIKRINKFPMKRRELNPNNRQSL